MKPTSEVLDVNEARERDEKDLDKLLSSPEFRNKALTIEDHEKYFDGPDSDKKEPYAEDEIHRLHL